MSGRPLRIDWQDAGEDALAMAKRARQASCNGTDWRVPATR